MRCRYANTDAHIASKAQNASMFYVAPTRLGLWELRDYLTVGAGGGRREGSEERRTIKRREDGGGGSGGEKKKDEK